MTDKLKNILTGCALFGVLLCIMPIYAADDNLPDQKHTEKEIRGIVAKVEQELDGVKKSKAGEIASKEVQLIEKSLARSKSLLDQKKLEDAYYQIEITRACFALVKARLELYNSKQALEQSKDKKASTP